MKIRWIRPKKWYGRSSFELLEDCESLIGIVIPKGFISDGISIPWFLRWLISSTGSAFQAGVLHDYLITIKEWKDCTSNFNKELKLTPYVGSKERFVLVTGVRIWGYLRKIKEYVNSIRSKYFNN